ncbi:unnamed protein product, partial [Allacma fusca]
SRDLCCAVGVGASVVLGLRARSYLVVHSHCRGVGPVVLIRLLV